MEMTMPTTSRVVRGWLDKTVAVMMLKVRLKTLKMACVTGSMCASTLMESELYAVYVKHDRN